jgi:hypothetical protein
MPVPRDQRQQVVRRRLGRDDAGAADVDHRAEEHVELRAVVQRQRVQHDVARAMLASTAQLAYCQITASCVSIAPLGMDSVPLV